MLLSDDGTNQSIAVVPFVSRTRIEHYFFRLKIGPPTRASPTAAVVSAAGLIANKIPAGDQREIARDVSRTTLAIAFSLPPIWKAVRFLRVCCSARRPRFHLRSRRHFKPLIHLHGYSMVFSGNWFSWSVGRLLGQRSLVSASAAALRLETGRNSFSCGRENTRAR